MFRFRLAAAAALWLGLSAAHASDLTGSDPRSGKPAQPVPAVPTVIDEQPAACGNHGTTVEFVESPSAAARQALKEEKLVFVLHVSGHFEDPRFT